MTTLSPVLLTNRANVRSLADFGKDDRIAIPAATSPQLYFLQMQSEKLFGKYDKLRSQIVVLPHPQAAGALMGGRRVARRLFLVRALSPRSRSPTGASIRC